MCMWVYMYVNIYGSPAARGPQPCADCSVGQPVVWPLPRRPTKQQLPKRPEGAVTNGGVFM